MEPSLSRGDGDPIAEKGLTFGGSVAISSKNRRERQVNVGKGEFQAENLKKQILILFLNKNLYSAHTTDPVLSNLQI